MSCERPSEAILQSAVPRRAGEAEQRVPYAYVAINGETVRRHLQPLLGYALPHANTSRV
jgi:hypothetical protein